MATSGEFYYGLSGSPAWAAIAAGQRIGFFNTLGVAGSPITPDSLPINTFNVGSHIIDGTPGADVCLDPHTNNVKYLTSTTMSVNGGGSETINDTNLADTEASFRWHFNDGVARTVQNCNIFAFNGSVQTTRAVGVDCAMYVKGNSMSSWQVVNDDTNVGPAGFTTGGIGGSGSGNISGSGLDRGSANTDQYWYCALSVSTETPGAKTALGCGMTLEYV